jgi:hypothetical protein
MGGDPSQIQPSGTGLPPPGKPPHPEHRLVGKIDELLYDHFGDFIGFVLETNDGEYRRFDSREPHMERLAETAWRERMRVAVSATPHHHDRPLAIALLA